MPFLDFTLNNPKISSYLEGTSDFPPVGELIYIHTHFIENNFLSQIEVMINIANEILLKDSRKKGQAFKLKAYAEKFGAQISQGINEDTAPGILETLKQIYQLTKTISK